MSKQFKIEQIVKVAGSYKGRVIGLDTDNQGLYLVEILEGPQKGRINSYKSDMLK